MTVTTCRVRSGVRLGTVSEAKEGQEVPETLQRETRWGLSLPEDLGRDDGTLRNGHLGTMQVCGDEEVDEVSFHHELV